MIRGIKFTFFAVLLLLATATAAWADGALRDSTGQTVVFSDLLGERPLLLVPVYYKCPNICSFSVAHILDVLQSAKLRAGTDLNVVVLSFDPREGPADAAAFASQQVKDHPWAAGTPIYFLTGPAAASNAVLEPLGIHPRWDAKQGQFAHMALAVWLAPNGRPVGTFNPLSVTPAALTTDMAKAAADQDFPLADVILRCFHLAVIRSHDAAVLLALRIAGVLVVIGMAGWIMSRLRRNGAA